MIGDTIRNCHTSCALRDANPPVECLEVIKGYLDTNADSIIALLITNPDAIDVAEYGDVIAASGIEQYVFQPGEQLSLDQISNIKESFSVTHLWYPWVTSLPLFVVPQEQSAPCHNPRTEIDLYTGHILL
jgi:hypothetical protein